MTSFSRREALKLGGVGAGVTVLGMTLPLGQSAETSDWISTSVKPTRFARRLVVPPTAKPTLMTDGYGEFWSYDISEQRVDLPILNSSGTRTPMLGYAVTGTAASVPGPVIKVDQNTRVRFRMRNRLPGTHPQFGHPMSTSLHLHGSASLPQYDGYSDDLTPPGRYKDYWFPNHQNPRTIWYHDHAPHYTAPNVYSGLAAQYHIQNAWEKEHLPQGKYDLPLTITDAMFARNGTLAYMDRDHSGLWGDIVLVNGVPWPYHDVERRFYRCRILLAALSRSMNLEFVNTRTGATVPTYVVATDAGLTQPQQITNWRHGGAERYEMMVDFGACRTGDRIELRNRSGRNNRDFLHTDKVMQFRVTSAPTDTRWNTIETLPASEIHEVMTASPYWSRHRRDIDLEHDDDNNDFLINGMSWHDVQQSGFNLFLDDDDPPRPGDYEIWRIENRSGGWHHPLHIHLVDFRILRRRGGSGRVEAWEKGPKDVVFCGEGEEIEVLVHYGMPPKQYPDGRSTGQAGMTGDLGGRYMIHCHNLTHEDHDMMGQFIVAASDGSVDLSDECLNHPIHAAPPV